MAKQTLLFESEPDEPVSLYYAVEWVVSRNGTQPETEDNKEQWLQAITAVLDAAARGDLKVTGVERDEANFNPEQDATAKPAQVSADVFRRCAFQSPHHIDRDFDLLFGDCVWALRMWPQYRSTDFDEEKTQRDQEKYKIEPDPPYAEWEDGFSDALLNREHCGWVQLTVLKRDVVGLWPPLQAFSNRGRPKTAANVIDEYERRVLAGEALPTREQEAKYLLQYYRRLFAIGRNGPAPTCGAIKNVLIAQDEKMGRKNMGSKK
jgi:hypothetical protein